MDIESPYAAPDRPVTLYRAPEWVEAYLNTLIRAVGYKGRLAVAVCEPDVFEGRIGVTDDPDAFIHLQPDGPDIIVLPRGVENTNRTRNVIRHEFVHALHAEADRAVMCLVGDDEEAWNSYMVEVEKFVDTFAVLLGIVDHFDVQYVGGEKCP